MGYFLLHSEQMEAPFEPATDVSWRNRPKQTFGYDVRWKMPRNRRL